MIKERIKQQAELMEPLVGHDRLHYLIDIAREVSGLKKRTGEQAGIGLWRENFGFPESKKLKPRFL